MSRVLVVGAGFLGIPLGEALAREGHEVYGLRRTIPASPPFPLHAANVLDPDALQRVGDALPPIKTVIYAVPPGGRDGGSYRELLATGLSNVLKTFAEARCVFVSSSAVYGQESAVPLGDSTEPLPKDERGRWLREAEDLALSHGRSPIVLRPSGIYGSGRYGLLREALGSAAPKHTGITNRVYRDDLVSIVKFLLHRSDAQGAYLCTDLSPAPLDEVYAHVRAHPLAPAARTILGESPCSVERNRQASSRPLVAERLQAMGFRFSYPSYRQGYDAILKDLTFVRV
jgi:nucleoside-diphosphate-sugar epimerase